MSIEPLICPQCGGHINRAKMECEHCGTQFKTQSEVVKIITQRPGEHTLCAEVAITNDTIPLLGAEKTSEIALREIAEKMARCIMPYISIQTSRDEMWTENMTVVRGRLRVLDPKEWVR